MKVRNFLTPFLDTIDEYPEELRNSHAVRALHEQFESLLAQRTIIREELNELLDHLTFDTPTDVYNALLDHLARSTIQYKAELERDRRARIVDHLFSELDSTQVYKILLLFHTYISLQCDAKLGIQL